MRRVTKLFVVLSLVSAVLFGCQTSRTITIADSHHGDEFYQVRGVPVRGRLDYDEYRTLEYRAGLVRAEVWGAVRSITIDNDATHYGPRYVIAHCHSSEDDRERVTLGSFGPPDGRDWQSGDICLKPEAIRDIVFWHEIVHAWHFRLTLRGDFENEWRRVAGDVYGPDNNPPDAIYPMRGLLRHYSSQMLREDVADTLMFVLSEIHDGDTPYDRLLAEAAMPDFRYGEKVRLLWRYGFLSDEDYRKFSDTVGLD